MEPVLNHGPEGLGKVLCIFISGEKNRPIMASQDASTYPACLICLETPDALKVVTTCKHAFCRKCLTTHIKKCESASGNFACPSCQVDCPLPGNGVDGLRDYDGDEEPDHADRIQDAQETSGGIATCESCHYAQNKDVNAEHLCEECGCIYLCPECAQLHGKNKATAKHVLVTLSMCDDGRCKKHKKTINRYCCTCDKPCCHLCILLDHGDHELQGISEVFHALVEEVSEMSMEQMKKSKDLKKFVGQLNILKTSEVTRRGDVLIREIEDHAEVCITQIIEQKEALKEQAKDYYKFGPQVEECLEKVPTIARLDDSLAMAKDLLSRVETHPRDIQRLSSVRQEIVKYSIEKEIDIEEHWESYKGLLDKPLQFVPSTPTCNIGVLEARERKRMDLKNCKLIFEKKLEVDDPTKVIPCVVILGNDFYAIAHPSRKGQYSDAIDIYKVPGQFQRTFKNHADSIYDMAANPDGRLAVLAKGSMQESCCVRLFHLQTGYMKSTADFPVRNPLSFGVNIRHQNVILSNDGGRKIAIYNEDGSVDLTHEIVDIPGIHDASRIACSRKYIYVLGGKQVAVFEVQNKNLVLVTTSGTTLYAVDLTNISVTDSDEVLLSFDQGVINVCFGRYVLTNRMLKLWSQRQTMVIAHGIDTYMSISASETYIVTSQEGSIVRVYKYM
jgi:hypothetical protein